MGSRSRLALLVPAAFLCFGGPALAEYPDKTITYIVPWGPGGSSDVGVRTWAPYMEECLGVSINVINKPGAGGLIGFAEIANAKPDGYTLGSVHIPNMPVGAITGDGKYKLDSFTYLGNYYSSNSAINTSRAKPKFTSLDELVKHGAGNNAPIRIGIGSVGSDDYLAALRFAKIANFKVEFIPLGDTSAARNALLGGHVDMISISAAETAPFADQFLTLGVASEKRAAALPDVATFKEQGYDLVAGSSHIIGAPAGLPPEAKDKLSQCFDKVGADQRFLDDATKRSLLLNVKSAAQTNEMVTNESAILQQLWQAEPWK